MVKESITIDCKEIVYKYIIKTNDGNDKLIFCDKKYRDSHYMNDKELEEYYGKD